MRKQKKIIKAKYVIFAVVTLVIVNSFRLFTSIETVFTIPIENQEKTKEEIAEQAFRQKMDKCKTIWMNPFYKIKDYQIEEIFIEETNKTFFTCSIKYSVLATWTSLEYWSAGSGKLSEEWIFSKYDELKITKKHDEYLIQPN